MLMLFSRLGIRALYAGDDKIAVGCCNFFIVCRFFMDDDFSQTRESRYCFYAKYNVVCGGGEKFLLYIVILTDKRSIRQKKWE